MKLILLVAIVVALLLFLVLDLGERAVEPSPAVKTSQQWGTERPPYVVDSAMFTTTTSAPVARARTAPKVHIMSVSSHPCGPTFDLPPCYVMMRESGGNPNAYNPTGCYEPKTGRRGCRGKWQCSSSTCCGCGTEEEQDAEARVIWNHGEGCAHWNACV